MNNTICIVGQRAHSGKTATAVGVAAAYALMEKRTLLIDCDPQANATSWAGMADQAARANIYNAFMGQIPVENVILQHTIKFLSVLPARIDLFQAEHNLAVKPGKEMILNRIVNRIGDAYDYIIIDAPSTLGFFTICALAAADWAVIPIRCQSGSLVGLNHLLAVIRMVREELNPGLKIGGMLFTMKEKHSDVPDYLPETADGEAADTAFRSVIPKDDAVEMSYSRRLPIPLFDIMSKGAQSYFDLAMELNSRMAGAA